MIARLWIFSDVHQHWPENAWDPAGHAPAGGFDAAVVAGDVHMPLVRALDWLAERLTGVPVVYVPGNHDMWWDRGEDADTTAAVAGQIAGAVYGASGIPTDWLGKLAWRERIEGAADRLYAAR